MSPETPASLSVVFHVIDILDELGIRYHFGGSFASAIYGVPRQTMDTDLVVDLSTPTVNRLVDQLRDRFYVELGVAMDAVVRRVSFNAIHLASGFKIDFFVKGDGDFDELELERSQPTQISTNPPRTAMVKTAEDTVLRKLQWYRSGGEVSDRQWTKIGRHSGWSRQKRLRAHRSWDLTVRERSSGWECQKIEGKTPFCVAFRNQHFQNCTFQLPESSQINMGDPDDWQVPRRYEVGFRVEF